MKARKNIPVLIAGFANGAAMTAASFALTRGNRVGRSSPWKSR
jgi:predicted esterase